MNLVGIKRRNFLQECTELKASKKFENGDFFKGRVTVFYFPPALKFMKSRTQNNVVLLRQQ